MMNHPAPCAHQGGTCEYRVPVSTLPSLLQALPPQLAAACAVSCSWDLLLWQTGSRFSTVTHWPLFTPKPTLFSLHLWNLWLGLTPQRTGPPDYSRARKKEKTFPTVPEDPWPCLCPDIPGEEMSRLVSEPWLSTSFVSSSAMTSQPDSRNR